MEKKLQITELLASEAKKSPMQYRHGAVIVKKGKILGSGYNIHCQPPRLENIYRIQRKNPSIHAEMSCLKGLRHDQIRGSDIFVGRISKKGEFRMSYPCKRCISLLTRKGIKKVLYTKNPHSFGVIYL